MTFGIFQDLHANLPALQKALEVFLASAGCFDKAEVSLGLLKVSEENLTLKKLSVPYLDNGLMEAFEEKKVPARSFITRTFITRNRPE